MRNSKYVIVTYDSLLLSYTLFHQIIIYNLFLLFLSSIFIVSPGYNVCIISTNYSNIKMLSFHFAWKFENHLSHGPTFILPLLKHVKQKDKYKRASQLLIIVAYRTQAGKMCKTRIFTALGRIMSVQKKSKRASFGEVSVEIAIAPRRENRRLHDAKSTTLPILKRIIDYTSRVSKLTRAPTYDLGRYRSWPWRCYALRFKFLVKAQPAHVTLPPRETLFPHPLARRFSGNSCASTPTGRTKSRGNTSRVCWDALFFDTA